MHIPNNIDLFNHFVIIKNLFEMTIMQHIKHKLLCCLFGPACLECETHTIRNVINNKNKNETT